MRHNPLLLSDRVKKVLNRDSTIVYHFGLTAILFFEMLLDHDYYSKRDLLGIFLSGIIFSLLGLVRYFNLWSVNDKPLLYLSAYHIVFGLGFALFAPAYSPYLIVWLVLIFVTNFYYGYRGTTLSLSVLFIVFLNQSFRLLPAGSSIKEFMLYILVQFFLFSIVSFFLSETEKVSDQDRKLFVTSIDKAQLERQRLISLINSMGDGVISTDDKGVIKLYNAAALNILDTNTTLQEKNINDVMTIIDQSAKVVNLITEAAKENSVLTSTDHLLVYPDGEKINLYLNISPIKLSFRQNTERGYIVSFRDITREKSLEEERNEFISVVSHELRTPIAITEANISNAQFIVEKGNDLGAVKTALEASHKQALFLANMINDLSTLSRAERGKLDMKTEQIDPREIISSLNDDYKKDAETKGLTFSTAIEDGTPETISSNRLYVREILQNFITNSIKYTKEGSVTVTVNGDENGIVFIVKDTGIGISKSDQKRVFDKFFRSEDFRTRESSGTGLGLYVTKKLMKLIGAEIELKSKLNEGSSFIVHIPDLRENPIVEQ